MALKNKYGVSICIITLVFLPSVLLQDRPVHYKGVTQKDLERKLLNTKNGGEQHYYVGLTQESGTELESVCHRSEQQKCLNECVGKSKHKTDIDAEENGLRLVEVFYLDAFSSLKDAYALEKRLIGDDWKPANTKFSLNMRSGQKMPAGRVLKDTGIVYLRIYEKNKRLRTGGTCTSSASSCSGEGNSGSDSRNEKTKMHKTG